ncbi:MAG TPA: efflux transporter outer membrane subunit [Sphingomicrobium sp.]|nr:efflux transporter outer membrane subunit [Sphingomicrobium sp.]
MNAVLRSGLSAAGLLLTSCSLAPAYVPPPIASIPPSFKEEPGWEVARPSDSVARGEWWSMLRDPVLDRLERTVAITNENVAAARAAYDAERAIVIQERSSLFPSVTASASAGTSPFSGGGSNAAAAAAGAKIVLAAEASWEADLWGRLHNSVTQARANAQASAGDLASASLSAQAELATDYVQLRGTDAERQLLDATVKAYTRALTIAANKYNAGAVAHSDVYQAQVALSNAIASRQDLDRQRAILEHAIAVLTGENPSTFALAPADWKPIVPVVPGILPATLLERRPDIAAAERRVAAANANIGIQRAAYFPQVTLSAAAGTGGSGFAQLFSAATTLWSIGMSGLMTLLDSGRRHGQVLQARAQFDQAAAMYREAVLTAFQEVEDNLAATRVLASVTQSRLSATEAANRAETIANNQYLDGIIDYAQVIVVQTGALNARRSQIQAVVDQQAAAIALIRAIGGSWAPAEELPNA